MNLESFFKLSYGLYVITAKDGEELSGYIATTAFQVTAEPPQIAISCHKDNQSAKTIEKSKAFGISVLGKDADSGLIGTFGYSSSTDNNKFKDVDYKIGSTGSPLILSNSIATFECEVVDKFDVGTHVIFVGKVVEAELLNESKDPLTYAYYRDAKKGLAPKNAPTYIDKEKLQEKEPEPTAEKSEDEGANFICTICAYVYEPKLGDETQGVPAGTSFVDVPEDWVCPVCAAAKSFFVSEN